MVMTRIGELAFDLGVPTPDTVAKLYDTMDFQRAVLCYLWAAPIVGMQSVRVALGDNARAGNGDPVLVEGYRDVSTMLGSNVTTPYVLAWLDLSEGPMVLDYPAGATGGALIDWWDRPIADTGGAGIDGGRGAVFVLVGPGQAAPSDVPEGAHVLRSRTNNVLLFCRVLGGDRAQVERVASALRVHRLGPDVSAARLLRFRREGALTSMAHPRGLAYWECLAAALDKEPIEDRDRFFAAMLKPLGIERGRPFRPDARQAGLLAEAAFVGEATAKANSWFKRFPGIRFRPDVHWEFFIAPGYAVQQDTADGTRFEERTTFFYEVMGASNGVMTTTLGEGSAYLSAYHDRRGRAFDGAKAYRLHVPPKPPAKLFWSVTLYDCETRGLIQNAQQIADRSSRQDLRWNADGSVDLVFAPTAPEGLEANWIPTMPGKAWYAYLRLFGPLQAYFDRSWPLPDIEMDG